MSTLTIACLQFDIAWQHADKNRQYIEQELQHLAKTNAQPDIVVLPEMFTTGFSMDSKHISEPTQGETVNWLTHMASEYNAAFIGSVATALNETTFVNRCYFISPDEQVAFYDKRHLFRMGNEDQHYQAGSTRKVVEFRGAKILLQICYDLRFPVFARNNNDYDIAIFVANWPKVRSYAWSTLLSARAIENQSYVIGCNRVGKDTRNTDHDGHSAIINFDGKPLVTLPADQSGWLISELSIAELQQYRQSFPAYLDSDQFELKL